MAKKQLASSAPEKLTRVSGTDIIAHGKKPETIELLKRIAADPREPDFSDIPYVNDDKFWQNAMSVQEYFEIRRKKQVVTLRIDKDVLAWLRSEGGGYQTRVNQILRKAMAQAAEKRSA